MNYWLQRIGLAILSLLAVVWLVVAMVIAPSHVSINDERPPVWSCRNVSSVTPILSKKSSNRSPAGSNATV